MPPPHKAPGDQAPATPTRVDSSRAQTLDRGLRALEVIAAAPGPMSIGDLADALALHRSVTYRIVRTLEDHNLVRRDADGGCVAGTGLALLARSVRAPLQSAAVPELSALVRDLQVTAFLVVRDGDEAVTLESIEPRDVDVHVAYKPGLRHPVASGAPGIALLAGAPPVAGERREVTAARALGWAHSQGEVLPGMASVAAPVLDEAGEVVGAVAVVFLAGGAAPPEQLGSRVKDAASAVSASLRG